jgi:hypothetical protein
MSRLIKFVVVAFLISPVLFAKGSVSPTTPRKFDEFGDLNCEDEYARLDNFAIQLQQVPDAKGVIIFYGGKTFRGRLPRRGEGAARAARIKPYLVMRRGIPSSRIVVINGGYLEHWMVEFWILPQEISTVDFKPTPSISLDQIRFRQGRASPRVYRCRV